MAELTTLELNALLVEAVGQHQRNQLDAAKLLYRRVLAADPRQPDALHFLGVIARQQGDPDAAVALIEQAIALRPHQASWHCNLGAALQDLGRADQALTQYEHALRLDPRYALAFCNRGNSLRSLGRLEQAVASYEHALDLRAGYPEAWCNRAIALNDLARFDQALASAERALALRPNYAEAQRARAHALQGQGRCGEAVDSYERALALHEDGATYCARGTALQRLQRFDEALASYERAIGLRPQHPLAYQYRGNTLRALGRQQEAIAAYRRALELGGDATQIEFALAALGAASVPKSSPAAYVTALFDGYAEHFDEHLVERLGYHTPALLDAAIAPLGVHDAQVADLGCGTGLCGSYLRRYARILSGVDLSPRMLEKARARGLYDALACADISAWLGEHDGELDLIVAADVLVYLGELSELFERASRALTPSGYFCFSVEAGEGDSFTLTASHRYAHALPYIEQLARQAGFALQEAARQCLRLEGDAPVDGYIVVLRKG